MNIDKRYKDIKLIFHEGPHTYNDSLGNNYISTTTILHKYKPEFDKEYWLRKKAKELGITPKKLEEQWNSITKEACERGSNTHNGLEDGIKSGSMFKDAIQYLDERTDGEMITVSDLDSVLANSKLLDLNQFIEATDNKYPEIYRVFEFYVERGYTIYSEIGVYLIDYLISGTIDILCIRDTDFVILDWKTNRDGLKFESGYYKKDKTTIPNQLTNEWVSTDKRMLPPLGHMQDCNGNHYTMQLSLYAIGVEMILGIPCVGLGLCHIGSAWKLNKYGQPFRDVDGYHVDPDKPDTVNWYRIDYRRK